MDWTSISVPTPLVKQIEKLHPLAFSIFPNCIGSPRRCSSPIMGRLGYPSKAVFVAEAVREHLTRKRIEYDNIGEEIEIGRKMLGRDDEK